MGVVVPMGAILGSRICRLFLNLSKSRFVHDTHGDQGVYSLEFIKVQL